MHRTGLRYTSVYKFQAGAVFYPDFYPKRLAGVPKWAL
jgi:hypothetical protein